MRRRVFRLNNNVSASKNLYGRDYDRCKTSSISANSLKDFDLEMLSDIVWDTVGSYYRDGRDAKSLRMQYRDDDSFRL